MGNVCAAVFGLGSMGFGIAKSCLNKKLRTLGVDIDQERVKQFQALGGDTGAIDECLGSVDVALIVVLNAEQTESVLFGANGIVPRMKKNAVVVSCATVPPAFAVSMEQACKEHAVHYLDAPISGGSIKAGNGQLTIMASGTDDAFAAAQPALDATAEKVFNLGSSAGPGSAMKAVNQMLAGVHIAAMAEALTFGLTQGVSAEKFLEVIPECAGTSWMLENRAPHIVNNDYTPHSQVNIWLKDLGIVLDIAKQSNYSAPLTATALQQYIAAADQGLGLEDDAAVAKVYAGNAGVALPGAS